MNNIPSKLRSEIKDDPYYRFCARADVHECAGRITWEHALTFRGSQIQKRFAILPLCAKAHSVDEFQDGGDLNKEINIWMCLNRATDEELCEISKAKDYFFERRRLNEKYGYYREPANLSFINYPFLASV